MKIQNLNFLNLYSFKNETVTDKPVEQNNFNYCKALHPQEILGRSQVNFTGSNFEFSENDRKFIDSTAKNLRLSPEQKKILEDTTADYLKENNYESFDYLEDIDKIEEQNEYCERINKVLDFSDNDYNIFCSDFMYRVCYYCEKEDYEPQIDKYAKDLEVFDHICEKYDINDNTKFEMFDIMKFEAKAFECDTVFDMFTPDKDPKKSTIFYYISKNIGEDIAWDMIIDLANVSLQSENERHASVNKTKMRDKVYNEMTDFSIAKSISEKYNINEDCIEDIVAKIEQRRNKDVSVPQIAFELADEYNLPSGAEKDIEETIIITDSLRDILKDRK